MPTIVDVAKLAGVSIATVSRVVNNSSHPVNAETRARILEAIETLNFVPNPLARALVSEKSRLIGVIVGDASDPYFANIVRGISLVAQEHGYLTVICNTDRVPEVELDFVRLLRDYCADGLIFVGGGLANATHQKQLGEIVDWFKSNQVPVVALGNQFLTVPQVNINDAQAAQDMTEYLIQLGHRHIGFITGPVGLTTSQLRLNGYQQALARHAITFIPELVSEGDFTYDGGRRAARHLMAQPIRPTAIFGSNDREAMGCLSQLREEGIRVPEQVSVVGFDDVEAAQYVHPPLTTVQVPMQDIGAKGMQQLLQGMDSKEIIEPKHILPHRLVIRASSGPSPKGA